jgi:hypothetical protein
VLSSRADKGKGISEKGKVKSENGKGRREKRFDGETV